MKKPVEHSIMAISFVVRCFLLFWIAVEAVQIDFGKMNLLEAHEKLLLLPIVLFILPLEWIEVLYKKKWLGWTIRGAILLIVWTVMLCRWSFKEEDTSWHTAIILIQQGFLAGGYLIHHFVNLSQNTFRHRFWVFACAGYIGTYVILAIILG